MNFTIQRCIISKCRSNVNINFCRKLSTTLMSQNKSVLKRAPLIKSHLYCSQYSSLNTSKVTCVVNEPDAKVLANKATNYSSLQLKRRPKKRKSISTDEGTAGTWNVKALATSDEYNLEGLVQGLNNQKLYSPHMIITSTTSLPDVIHAVAKYEVEHEPREIFFFREGTIVMWNISDLESENIFQFLMKYEDNRYTESIVQAESEVMVYSYADSGKQSHLSNGNFILSSNATILDKYTFSNAMAQSVKLGTWEASLDDYIDSIEFVTEDLKAGKKIRLTQEEVLRKQGELFALRHSINLSSDLLDTPDFYWERDDLEVLYQQTCAYFNIAKRTRVINEKLNHCVELIGILSSHLSDRHHIRLEWMIIILIMVEVAFEILHYIDKYFSK